MRIKTIQLAWFRGAADPVKLEPNCKSMVIYGENGSGKSSFVDCIEYQLNNGRISHLAHEYSGKHQEKAIHNTHKPQDQKTEFTITFGNNSEIKTEIRPNGTSTCIGVEAIHLDTWNYRSTVLRQDEVAAFIHGTKGDKYSALLPLLGLGELVTAAENLRQLCKNIEAISKIKENKTLLKASEVRKIEVFKTAKDQVIIEIIDDLYSKYCSEETMNGDALSRCKDIDNAIQAKSSQVSTDYDQYRFLQNIGQLKLKENIGAVRLANSEMASTVEPLIVEKLEVLQSTSVYVDKLIEEKELNCPACGRAISVNDFQSHIKFEQQRLEEIIDINKKRRNAVDVLCDTVKSLKSGKDRLEAALQKNELIKVTLGKNFAYLSELKIEALRQNCDEEKLAMLSDLLLPMISAANFESQNAPANTQELLADKKTIDIGKEVIGGIALAKNVKLVESLISLLTSIEQKVRTEIRARTELVIDEISVDIQKMWEILHPNNTIKKVCLYIPEDEDKAIDISLEFYGIEQPSPRITLSEGYRNSLGLSIFLSMAKHASDDDRPLFLDDVIVSLDRNHRGMVADLLEREFAKQQVIIFTHDRDWYSELRHQLDDKNWLFKALLPYETPDIGIRWSHKTTTFGDARIHIKGHPDSAGNDARKIMDVELGLIAEKLRVNFPYLRAEKNDKRMAHDFLERIIANGKQCFQKRLNNNFELYADAIEAFSRADRLIVSWGNRASHSFDLVSPEAEKLIDVCEKALEFFKCPSCSKNVWFTEAESSEWVQCQCGEIRWRYGKAS